MTQGLPVVLLHGMARTAASMRGLRRHLEANGHPTWAHTYPSRRQPLSDLARTVAALAQTDLGTGPVFAVTHSLGGVLVRHMGGLLPIRRAVLLAPPNGGSRVAQALSGHPLFRWFYGPAGQQVACAEAWPSPPCPFAVIAGTEALTLSNPTSWVTRVAGLIPPGEPSDGTVTVAETRLDGMAAFATVAASHTWIMDHAETRRLVLGFLRDGRF
ncbi:MAG: alpha/beta fold hydrolase [Myxococcales bacterium]|nr:alpha/beta fold hydrolase [Myxococcales bacterium]